MRSESGSVESARLAGLKLAVVGSLVCVGGLGLMVITGESLGRVFPYPAALGAVLAVVGAFSAATGVPPARFQEAELSPRARLVAFLLLMAALAAVGAFVWVRYLAN